jgi:2-polyprenyl-3-methyl-5-hydroxy-6-metoxy-1,4-benzoquinol methylase
MSAPASTFRDPDASLSFADGRILRAVRPEASQAFSAMLEHPFVRRLMADGKLVGTARVAHADVAREREGVLYEHDRIPFVSYPHEWSPTMLACAAEFTSTLCLELLEHGFELKDATPANILFRGAQPVWVDVPSIVVREPGRFLWNAQDQFERCFLLPLIASREAGIPLDWSLRDAARGLDHAGLARILGARRWLKPSLWRSVALPNALHGAAPIRSSAQQSRWRNDAQARFSLERTFRRNLRRTRSLQRALEPAASMWREYTQTRTHYAEQDVEQKTAFVRSAIDDTKPTWVLDVGANTGEFSEHAAARGAAVVAIDTDEAAVNGIFSTARRSRANILPMVGNFASPSPALGWANGETQSFLDRAEKRFDLVLLLAIIHHLRVTHGVPVERILRTVAGVTKKHVVIEHVPVEDPRFQQLSRGRDSLYGDCSREVFESILASQFAIESSRTLANGRTLYLARCRA